MLPFSYRVHSFVHHSLGALWDIASGSFGPRRDYPDLGHVGLQQIVADTHACLEDVPLF